MKYLFFATLFLSPSIFANIECYYSFEDRVLEITPEMKVNGCTADFIWGFENVCFNGKASTLVKAINKDFYQWPSSGLKATDAKEINKDTVEYLGTDARNFYQAIRDIKRCQ